MIISLTRSNSEGSIGFLQAPERLNVLLSRARNCLIMIGNMQTYMTSKTGRNTWIPFFESMKTKNHLYDGLPVHCERHPEKKYLLKDPEDFDMCCPDGGCSELWSVLLCLSDLNSPTPSPWFPSFLSQSFSHLSTCQVLSGISSDTRLFVLINSNFT